MLINQATGLHMLQFQYFVILKMANQILQDVILLGIQEPNTNLANVLAIMENVTVLIDTHKTKTHYLTLIYGVIIVNVL